MTTRNLIRFCMLGLVMTSGSVHADKIHFTGAGGTDDWADAANWSIRTDPEKSGTPGAEDTVRIPGGSVVKLTSTVTISYLGNGVDGVRHGAVQLIIDGGTLVAVGREEFNSVSYNCPASFTVKNGGSATFYSRLIVGRLDFPGGEMIIHEGTVRVADVYYHNENYAGTETLGTRTTIHPGGLLDVDGLKLNAGVMDIAGGILIIRQHALEEVKQWIRDGRMIAMGGNELWKIKATFDEFSGWTTIISVSETDTFSVGMVKPAISDLFSQGS